MMCKIVFLVPKFALESEHLCRIIGYSSVERLLHVSTKAEVLNQKIISSLEAQPAAKFTCTVIAIKPNGLTVRMCGDVFGYVTTLHVKNKPSNSWQKGFRKGNLKICG